MSDVIVFGATGAVGRSTAIEASERGHKVWLAMRDTSKKIAAIPEEEEKAGKYARVQADLTDPDSVKKAIETSGAKSAFIYIIFQSKDHLRSSIQALKDAGVTWVVLLSSYTVQGDVRQVKPESLIPYHHAQTEIVLEEVGMPFAAIRPGYFASNHFFSKAMLRSGEVALAYPEVKYDSIDPKNIGQVAGSVLVQPKKISPSEPQIIYLMGPKLISQKDIILIIGSIIGKEINIEEVGEKEWTENYTRAGQPEPLVKYLFKSLKDSHEHPARDVEVWEKASPNILKYSGKHPTTLEEWAEANKEAFKA